MSQPAALSLWPSVSDTYSCTTKSCTNTTYLGTASTSGIKLLKHSESTNLLRWSVNHSVGIPKMTAPAIDYTFLAQLTNKTFIATGQHDKAPSHEFWMNYPSGSKKIYSHEVTSEIDFLNLFGVIQASWSFEM